ncbi:AAA family ATPase [Sorangium sp. So ce281]|uniref:AAA family ATPase n=1 Tax=unclassified Sorangium TaxID=2621164 RepID=UPI003F5FB96D
MLRQLELDGIGPADKLTFGPLAGRLNLITGDNGLGKSFLLDVAWWALTRTWPQYPAVPRRPDASIGFAFDGAKGLTEDVSPWIAKAQDWKRKRGRPSNPGLVLYARADGAFSVWDPAKNYRLYRGADGSEREMLPAYHFTPGQVFDELRTGDNQVVCRGLLDDWTRWQQSHDPRFAMLSRMLEALSEDPERPMEAGKPTRPFLEDVRDVPTIKMPYGDEVPVIFAAAGMQRMLKLAYLLTWAFSEHEEAARRQALPLSEQVVLLIDEPETHLHPRWQRAVLPGLLRTIGAWGAHAPRVQVIAATHSPLVLASVEPLFDPEADALWKLDLVDGAVQIAQDVWHKRGDVNRWLMSDVFDLDAATSAEAEAVLRQARQLLRDSSPDAAEVRRVNEALLRSLPEMDPFLVRWRYYVQQHAGRESA